MKDIQGTVAGWLQDSTGIPSYRAVPSNPPAEYRTVARRGGGLSMCNRVDTPLFVVANRAATSKRARELAYDAVDSLNQMTKHTDVFSVDVQSVYEENDPDTKQPRWKITVAVTSG